MIHLVTVVGAYAKLLPALLAHYETLGVEAFHVHLHLKSRSDPLRDEVLEMTRAFGCGVETITVCNWYQGVNPALIRAQMARAPEDWFIVADQDEFQQYPAPLAELFREAEQLGADHFKGALLDRVGEAGTIAPFDPGADLWEQYPWCGFVALPLLRADPRKITAARGRLALDEGQHRVLGGAGMAHPGRFIPVHHFKWTDDVADRLQARASLYRRLDEPIWEESERAVAYLHEQGGAFNLEDFRFLFARCGKDYPHLEKIRAICAEYRRSGVEDSE